MIVSTHLLWRSLVHSVSKDLTHWYKLYRAMKEYILWPQQLDQRMSFQNISFIAFTLSYPEYTLSIDHEIVHCALCSSSAELTVFHLQHSRCAPFHSQTSWKPKYFRPPLAPMTMPIFDSVETSYNIYIQFIDGVCQHEEHQIQFKEIGPPLKHPQTYEYALDAFKETLRTCYTLIWFIVLASNYIK